MEDFEFYSPTRFVFGREAEKKTGALVKRCGGTKALPHFGGGSIKRNGVYDKVVASLEAAGVPFVALGGVQPNPRSGLVRDGIALCRREGVDIVLAVADFAGYSLWVGLPVLIGSGTLAIALWYSVDFLLTALPVILLTVLPVMITAPLYWRMRSCPFRILFALSLCWWLLCGVGALCVWK